MATDTSTDKMDLDSGQVQGEGTPEQEAHETYEPTEPGGSGDETVEITDTSGRMMDISETIGDTNTGGEPGVDEPVNKETATSTDGQAVTGETTREAEGKQAPEMDVMWKWDEARKVGRLPAKMNRMKPCQRAGRRTER